MDDWEELFAKAEGKMDPSAGQDKDEEEYSRPYQLPSSKRSKLSNEISFSAFLQQRCDSIAHGSWPLTSPTFRLGFSLVDGPCQGFKSVNDTITPDGPVCEHCRGSIYLHALEYNKDDGLGEEPRVETVFRTIRNLRCAAKILVVSSSSSSLDEQQQQPNFGSLDSTRIKDECRDLASSMSHLRRRSSLNTTRSTALLEPLKSKLARVEQLAKPFCGEPPVRKADWQTESYLDMAVRLIVACDDAYLHLYYQHLVHKPATTVDGNHHRRTDNVELIPHPTAYFGSMMQGTADLITAQATFLAQNDRLGDSRALEHVQAVFGWDLNPEKEHPLVVLHRWRWAETVLLFRSCMSWWSSAPHDDANNNDDDRKRIQKASRLWKATFRPNAVPVSGNKIGQEKEQSTATGYSAEFNEAEHETPAPPLLMEWRDSCRDFLCHLYAYSTISNNVLHQLKSVLLRLGVERLLEVGAGTGYLAYQLQQQGFAVDTYDIAPTGSEQQQQEEIHNEYHGQTPPFAPVRLTSSSMTSAFREVSSVNHQALVLCYPPPGSPMAHNALREFRKKKGQFLVHIGEFKGLTGSREFEDYLLRDMVLVERLPCLTWGTDASAITVWFAKNTTNKTLQVPDQNSRLKSLLVPCSHCESKEAMKRCRLLRLLCYCSKECCDSHSDARINYFEMAMIDVAQDQINFSDDLYFTTL